MRHRPRLLFLSQTLPYPPDGGVKIRTYNVLRLLSERFETTALCFCRTKQGLSHQDERASLRALRTLARIEAFPIPQEQRTSRFLWDHLRSVFSRRPYTVYTYESAEFRRRLGDLLKRTRYDLVHADSLDLSAYFPLLEGLPLVCVHHDVESVLLRRRAGVESRLWRRRYLLHQSELMEREEHLWCPRSALNVVVSPTDGALLSSLAPESRITIVPNGVDTTVFRPEPGEEDGIVFVGGTTWFPNRDALSFFCNRILPLLRKAAARIRVVWVGRASEEEIRFHKQQYGLELTGYVPDIRPYVREAACFVVPLRVGGGTRIKILDAWAMGKAIVSTSIGCEGLCAVDGTNILIRDTPEDFAQGVLDVLRDGALRRRLGQAARETVETRYSWEVVGRSMIENYLSLLDGRGSSTMLTRAVSRSAVSEP